MKFCKYCGCEIPEETKLCPACANIPSDFNSKEIYLYWGIKTPVIRRIVIKQLLLVLGIGMFVVFILLAALDFSSFIDVLPELFGVFIFLIILGLIIAGGIQIFTKGGPYMEYAVTKKGVGYKVGDTSKAINTITFVGSVLGGSASGAGASLINMAREMDFMKWKEMRSVTGYRKDNSIIFYRKELICPFDLYCPSEIFEKVIAIAREKAPQASIKIK